MPVGLSQVTKNCNSKHFSCKSNIETHLCRTLGISVLSQSVTFATFFRLPLPIPLSFSNALPQRQIACYHINTLERGATQLGHNESQSIFSHIEHDGTESPASAAGAAAAQHISLPLRRCACKTRHYFTLAEFQSDFKDTLLNLSARQIVPSAGAGCLKQWDDRGVLGSENFLEISNREADYYCSR